MENIKIGDTLVVIVTGNAKNPLFTKTIVKDIVYSFEYGHDGFNNYGVVVTEIDSGQFSQVGIRLLDIYKDDEGNWCYVKEYK